MSYNIHHAILLLSPLQSVELLSLPSYCQQNLAVQKVCGKDVALECCFWIQCHWYNTEKEGNPDQLFFSHSIDLTMTSLLYALNHE